MKIGFIPTEGGNYYQECLEEVILAEELGFDSAWLEEHHGVKNHYWPSPIIALAGIATRTSRIILGTDIIILPFYNPIRIAEDIALLDIMSNGRFVLGAAIGYRPDEFALYQLSMEKRGGAYAEAINLIRLLWTEEFSHLPGKLLSCGKCQDRTQACQATPDLAGRLGTIVTKTGSDPGRCLGARSNRRVGKTS